MDFQPAGGTGGGSGLCDISLTTANVPRRLGAPALWSLSKAALSWRIADGCVVAKSVLPIAVQKRCGLLRQGCSGLDYGWHCNDGGGNVPSRK